MKTSADLFGMDDGPLVAAPATASELFALLNTVAAKIDGLDRSAMSDDELRAFVVARRLFRTRWTVGTADAEHDWERRGAWRDDGSLSASIALGRTSNSCRRQAAYELRRAQRLQEMPATRAAVLDGRLSLDHVDLFVRYATEERWARFLRDEQALVDACIPFKRFDSARTLLRHWAQRVDDELDLARDKPAPSTLYASRCGDTGEAILDGHLSAIDAEIVTGELDRLAKRIRLEDKARGISRTPAQRRAAALVAMATRSVNATGTSARPLFQVIVGDDTARRLCELATGTVIHPGDLLPYVNDAFLEAFLFDGPTTIIAKSRLRTFRGALRKAIKLRDRSCQHEAGCIHPAADCDIDHIIPWGDGGETTQFNGDTVCSTHNRHTELRDQRQPRAPTTVNRTAEVRARLRWQMVTLAYADDW